MNNTTTQKCLMMLTPREKEVTFVFYLTTFILGLIGNVLVLVIIVKKRNKRTVNDLFIMNLAVTDLTLIFFIPLHIYDLFKTLPATLFVCNFVKPLMTVTFFVSIFTLTSMAVYRCKVILNPFRPEMKELSALILVGIIWASSWVITLPLMIITKPIERECMEDWPSVYHRRAYTASLFVLQYLLPLLIIAVAYVRIGLDLTRIRITRFSIKQKAEGKEANYKARSRENKQVVKTLATIVIMFAMCLLPGQVAWMLLDFGSNDQQQTAYLCIKFGVISSVFHSCVNPLIYGTLTRQFRRGYVKYLSYLLCCCESNSMVQKMRLIRVESTRLDSKRRITMSLFRQDSIPVHSNSEITKRKKTSKHGCLDGYLDKQLLVENKQERNENIHKIESRL